MSTNQIHHFSKSASRTPVRSTVPAQVVRAPANWRPQPCGLSRQEMRRLVIEQIG